jgi:hypothetical protein
MSMPAIYTENSLPLEKNFVNYINFSHLGQGEPI